MQAIANFHRWTPIRFRQYDPSTDSDYVHITGENSGCWSYVGRIGGVSNKVNGVATKSPALKPATLGFCSLTPTTQIHSGFPHNLNPTPPSEKIENVVSDLE